MLFSCEATDLGVAARTQASGQLAADVELDVGIAHEQGLRVGVDRDELDPFQPGVDHPVDSVDTTAADAYDLDHRYVVLRCASHRTFPQTALWS